MEPVRREDRREARTVEIALAVALGVAVVAVPSVGCGGWLGRSC